MIELTAMILTFNEKENIVRTVASLQWVPRLLLVDSFSTDETVELARLHHPNVEVIQRAFDSFAGQCNYGLAHIGTAWVLSLDADYVVEPKLADEIRALKPGNANRAYSAAFRYCVFGRPLRTTIYPPRTVLYRRDVAKYRDEGHGHRVHIDAPIARLRGFIDHDDRKPLSRWIRSQDTYTKIEATHLLAAASRSLSRQDRLRLRIFYAPAMMFLYLLFAKGLVLDGWVGWYYVMQRTIAEMLLSLRLLTERKKLEGG